MKTWVCKGEVSHGCGGGASVVNLKKAAAKFDRQVAKKDKAAEKKSKAAAKRKAVRSKRFAKTRKAARRG